MRLRDWTRPLALLAAPILLLQGRRVKQEVPILPEAHGPATGRVEPQIPGSAVGSLRPRSLLVFGESTAAGVGVDRHDRGMAGALARELAAGGSPVTWSVTARTGQTAAAARTELLPGVQGPYDDVVVLLGVNDTLALTRPALWRQDVVAIIDGLRVQVGQGGRIILAGVPQISDFRALPQPMRRIMGWHACSLDSVLREIAGADARVFHVDSPAVPSGEFLATDGFHPSEAGYQGWAQQLVQGLASSSHAG